MIISAVMYVAYVSVQDYRDSERHENWACEYLAYTISEDTYTALRISDFDEYADRLTTRSSYRAKLEKSSREDVRGDSSIDVIGIRDYRNYP